MDTHRAPTKAKMERKTPSAGRVVVTPPHGCVQWFNRLTNCRVQAAIEPAENPNVHTFTRQKHGHQLTFGTGGNFFEAALACSSVAAGAPLVAMVRYVALVN